MLLALRGLVRSIVDGIVMLARRLLNLVPLTRAFAASPSAAAPPLVTASWLHEHYARVKVVDASWYLPAMKRDGRAEFSSRRLPGARFFDIDATDDASGLPHMLPSARFFATAMDECGVSNDDHVVVYDGKGIFSAPRLWWMLRAFGHEKVSVLDGGYPGWDDGKRPIEEHRGEKVPPPPTPYTAVLQPAAVADASALLAHVSAARPEPLVIVDARARARFEGAAPEPRPECRLGHIPGSRSVPFTAVLDAETARYMLPKAELARVFADAGLADPLGAAAPPLVTSCGSGVTAAVVQLALAHLGRTERVSLYDGAWSEWGSNDKFPLATGPPPEA